MKSHTLTRRRIVLGTATLAATGLLSATRAIGQGLGVCGVCYDTGTNYMAGPLSRPTWTVEAVRRDMAAIRQDLHANAVAVFGTDLGRLAQGATAAAEAGLQVWLQPRLMEATQPAVIEHLAEAARVAETLRAGGAMVTLNLGCELTLFTAGLAPGTTMFERMEAFGTLSAAGFGTMIAALDAHLARALAAARSRFKGPITYSAGPWEQIDWSGFDLVGLDHYRDAGNRATYAAELRDAGWHGKPVIVTEFGCCTYEGAQDAGGDGWSIVDWTGPAPRLKGRPVRSEQVQADTIADLLDLFPQAGVAGAFVYQFIDLGSPHSPDPQADLDTASYAIVRVAADDPDGMAWQPKQAFHAIADRYGRS